MGSPRQRERRGALHPIHYNAAGTISPPPGSAVAGDTSRVRSRMDVAVSHDSAATMRQLYAQHDWPRLAQVAEQVVRQQQQNGEAWCYWGVGELMQLKGGPDKLLRASMLGDPLAGLWLGVLQEF